MSFPQLPDNKSLVEHVNNVINEDGYSESFIEAVKKLIPALNPLMKDLGHEELPESSINTEFVAERIKEAQAQIGKLKKSMDNQQ